MNDNPFQKIANRLKAIKQNLNRIGLAAIRDNEEFILELNTKEQIFKAGIYRTGQKITPSYAPSTVKRKSRQGLPSDRVILFETGDFHNSFFIKYDEGAGTFELEATDPKKQYLEARYGPDIYGLTDESLERLKSRLTTKVKDALSAYIYG